MLKKHIFLLLLLSFGLKIVTSESKKLIIINNALEHSFTDKFDDSESLSFFGAMNKDLVQALLEKDTPILVTKYLFYNLLFLQEVWDDFTNPETVDIKSKYPRYENSTFMIRPLIRNIQTIFDLIKESISNDEDNDEIATKIKDLFTAQDYSMLTFLQKIFVNFMHLLMPKMGLVSVNIEEDYLCKDVNDNFMLLVPRSQNYDLLPLTEMDTLEIETTNIKEHVSQLNLIDMDQERDPILTELGLSLLDALHILFPEKNSTSWDVYLTGHGSPETIHADIPAVTPENGTSSLFTRVLYFFKTNVNTNNLAISSCYPGGKKHKTIFNIETEFNNSTLATLPYTLLFLGTQPAATSSPLSIFPLPIAKKHPYINQSQLADCIDREHSSLSFKEFAPYLSNTLQALHKNDYLKASTSIESQSEAAQQMLIKLPNQDWMQPITFKKTVKTLSQIQLLTLKNKTMEFDWGLKIILLAANNIPVTLNFGDSRPKILPTTHLNYNFHFKKIDALTNVESFMGNAFSHLTESAEPMYFYIERFRHNSDNYIVYISDKSQDTPSGVITIKEGGTAIVCEMNSEGVQYASKEYDYAKAIQLKEGIINRANQQRLSITQAGIENLDAFVRQKKEAAKERAATMPQEELAREGEMTELDEADPDDFSEELSFDASEERSNAEDTYYINLEAPNREWNTVTLSHSNGFADMMSQIKESFGEDAQVATPLEGRINEHNFDEWKDRALSSRGVAGVIVNDPQEEDEYEPLAEDTYHINLEAPNREWTTVTLSSSNGFTDMMSQIKESFGDDAQVATPIEGRINKDNFDGWRDKALSSRGVAGVIVNDPQEEDKYELPAEDTYYINLEAPNREWTTVTLSSSNGFTDMMSQIKKSFGDDAQVATPIEGRINKDNFDNWRDKALSSKGVAGVIVNDSQ
jgi:hypothetical protein